MLSVKIQLVFSLLFHKMKEKLCLLVTVVIFQYIEEKKVGKSSTVPFIPAGKKSIFQHVQLETAADRDE